MAVADPLDIPLQLTLVPLMLAVTTVGWVTTAVAVAVQAMASVAVTVYVPAVSPEMVALVALVLQTKVMVPVPPVAEAEADPLLPPLQLTLLKAPALIVTAVGWVMTIEAVVEHPLSSLTVTVYVPAVNPVFVAAEPPPLHEK